MMMLHLTFALSLFLSLAQSSNDDECFDLPIVVLRPSEALPTKSCEATAPVIGPNCMKRSISGHIWTSTANPENEQHCINAATINGTTNATPVEMQYRGDSSLGLQKHQFSLTFAQPTTLLDLPSGKTWVLNGPFIDGSLLRNHLAHWLYQQTGRYSPRTQHVVLFQEQPELGLTYHGIYLILEHISFEPNRVGLEDSTLCPSGWAWQYNPLSYGVYAPNFNMDLIQNTFGSGQRPILEYPPALELTRSMRNYFVNTSSGPVPQFYRYLYYHMNDTSLLEEHIELGSFVDYLLHTELSLNQDAFRRSAWFFKASDEPINAGPIWDYNLAYGLGAASNHHGWLFPHSSLWKRLRCNYKFASLAIQRWQSLRSNALSSTAISNFIIQSSNPIKKILAKCKHDQWQSQERYCASVSGSNKGSYQAQLDLLVSSVQNRSRWMDEHIYELYTPLNDTICGATPGGASLPKFNCGPESENAACLDPLLRDQYIDLMDFPPLRKKQRSVQQPLNLFKEVPSIDPCWLSVGVSVLNGGKTPFCSGYGQCPEGPDATCECLFEDTFANCSPISRDGSMNDVTAENQSSTRLYFHYFFERVYVVLGMGVVSILGYWLYHKTRSSPEVSNPIMNGSMTTYGTQ